MPSWGEIYAALKGLGDPTPIITTIVALAAVGVSYLAAVVAVGTARVQKRISFGEKRPYLAVVTPAGQPDPVVPSIGLSFKLTNIGLSPAVAVRIRMRLGWAGDDLSAGISGDVWRPVIRPNEEVPVELKLPNQTSSMASAIAQLWLLIEYRDLFRGRHRDWQRIDIPIGPSGDPCFFDIHWNDRLRHFRRPFRGRP
jgi:hypothetical protein